MAPKRIDRVAVLGAGNMGHGIAEAVALAGFDVTMRDIKQEFVEDGYNQIEWSLEKLADSGALTEPVEAVLDRIDTTTDLESAVADADLVIGAVPEDMDVKREVFGEVDDYSPEHAILASNTSSLSITEISEATDRPERVVGTHFFNPPVKMDLVEVIYSEHTSDEIAETAYDFVEDLGKTPIYVRKDVHRFIVNNALGPFIDEPHWMVSEGEATVCEADAAMVHRRGYPMGPFELLDMTGIDVSYYVREAGDVEITPLMAEKVEAGDLGKKTGKGYYDYEMGDGPNYEEGDGEAFDVLRVEAMIANEAARLIGEGVATAEAIDTGMRLGTGFPEGPCTYADEIGLDIVLEKLNELHEEYGKERYEPAEYLVELVGAGRTGTAAGAGFHEY
jgi:enoyl-CoA hydratase/3-hydroxyacyl-CoA dehydrogenase